RGDRARGERGRHFATRQVDDGCAEPPHDLAAKARHADLETLEILQRVHLLTAPARMLHTSVAAHQVFAAERLAVKFVAKLVTPAEVVPSVVFLSRKAEWEVAHELSCGCLALPIIGASVTHLDGPRFDGVDRLERRRDLTCRKQWCTS